MSQDNKLPETKKILQETFLEEKLTEDRLEFDELYKKVEILNIHLKIWKSQVEKIDEKIDYRIRANMITLSLLTFILVAGLTILQAIVIMNGKTEIQQAPIREIVSNSFAYALIGYILITWTIKSLNHNYIKSLQEKKDEKGKELIYAFFSQNWLFIFLLLVLFYLISK